MNPTDSRPTFSRPTVLALDVGGTKLEAGVVRPGGELLSRRRVATGTGTAEELFAEVLGLLRAVLGEAQVDVDAIGVGCGGPMTGPDPSDAAGGAATVSPLNIAQWREFPLGPRLAAEFGLPVRVDNDAKALALGEGALGAAKGVDAYLAMVVSTGVGGGIVLDGRLLDGAAGNAGHIGHVIVEPRGRECVCGARGCLEAEVSGTAIAEVTGRPAAEAPLEWRIRTGRLVGRAVGSVCNLLDLRLAVVAGSVAIGFGEPFLAAARSELSRVARLGFSEGAEIRIGSLAGDGPLLGAAEVGFVRLGLADPPPSGGR
ncbi:MAG: ROK family protein [Microthrixaceae bacterium]